MIFPDTPQDIESIELRMHRQHVTLITFTILAPILVLIILSLVTGQGFWLAPIVLFLVVGGLNYYLMESRIVPRNLTLGPEGIDFETRQGSIRTYGWNDVTAVKEHLRGLRGRQRMEVYFNDNSEPLYLYPYAMRLTASNGKPAGKHFTDRMRATGVIWDRPIKYARVILAKHVASFKA